MTNLALVQMNCGDDRGANVDKACLLIEEAATHGARIICLQELFSTPYFCHAEDPEYWDLAESVPGPTTDRIGSIARKTSSFVVAPLYEKAIAGELYNTAAVIGPDGAVAGIYRKSSIPLSVMDDWQSREKFYFKPGNTGFTVFSTPFGVSLGVLICYDRHFPEAARVLALRGADVLLVPAATGGPSRATWEIEVRALAIANVCYVGAVNRVGHDNGDVHRPRYFGASLVCDFNGRVLSQASDGGDEVVYAEIDLNSMAQARNRLGWFRDRRPDLYGALAE